MDETVSATALGKVVNEIKSIVLNSRQQIAAQVNIALLHTYGNIGRVIVEDEMKKSVAGGLRCGDLEDPCQNPDGGTRQGFFPQQSLQYETILPLPPENPDGVWRIEPVALLRAPESFG